MPLPRKKVAFGTSTSTPSLSANVRRKRKTVGRVTESSQTEGNAETSLFQSEVGVSTKQQNRKGEKSIHAIVKKEEKATCSELQKYIFQSSSYHRQHVKVEFEKPNIRHSPSPVTEEAKGLWAPPKWRDFLLNLRNMRANNDAPVDSMGCHMTMDQDAAPEVMRYQSLIALMLSSQTKDQVTFAAMERLRERGLTVDNVLAMSDEELGKLIYPVGFWKTKVKYIKKTTQTLKDKYNGDIPDSVEKLCKLTGVGPKMAHICMKVAWNKITGIGVDTHVHRISNRIGWVKKPTSTPEDTRKALQSWLPFDLWSEVNHLMVGFGQTICLPVGPLCHECLNNDICPSSGLGRKTPKKTPGKTPNKSSPVKVDNKEQILKVKKELDLDEPTELPHKRKVASNKGFEIGNDDDMTNHENKVNLSCEASAKVTQKKKRVTPKKDETVMTQDSVLNIEDIQTKTSGNKEVLTKEQEKCVIEKDYKANKTRTKKQLYPKSDRTNEFIKKRSPRIKHNENKEGSENSNDMFQS